MLAPRLTPAAEAWPLFLFRLTVLADAFLLIFFCYTSAFSTHKMSLQLFASNTYSKFAFAALRTFFLTAPPTFLPTVGL